MHTQYNNKRTIRLSNGWPLNPNRSKTISDKYHEIMEEVAYHEQAEILELPEVSLFGPESGVITITFTDKLGEKYVCEISDSFYDAFSQIRFWLEDLCDESNDGCSAVVDDEDDLYLFHYENLPWIEGNNNCRRGIFMMVSDNKQSKPYQILCDKRILIKTIYEEVMHFSSGERVNTPAYMVTWGDASDDGYPDTEEGWKEYEKDCEEGMPKWKGHSIFQNRFRSAIVEEFIKC